MKVNFKTKAAQLLVALLVVGGVAVQQPDPATAQHTGTSQVSIFGANDPDVIPGEYIVVMRDEASSVSLTNAIQSVQRAGIRSGTGQTLERFDNSISGFSGALSPADLNTLRANPRVAFIEADGIMRASSQNWGQDRIDQNEALLDGAPYLPEMTGAGVHVYVIDTGIRTDQTQFAGRIGNGFVGDGLTPGDCNGHGTHVAGTVGGTTDGVAPGVMLHSVKVLNCSGVGSKSATIAGIDWVAENSVFPAVANLSLGGDASPAVDAAVDRLIDSGVTVVVAAGNEDQDACEVSPARVPRALTVGASTISDSRAYFSNWGGCVDVFAPGEDIVSADFASVSGRVSLSGTSMAAPHVAGAAALALERTPLAHVLAEDPALVPNYVDNYIYAYATWDALADIGDSSPDVLLNVRSQLDDLDCFKQPQTGSQRILGELRNVTTSYPVGGFGVPTQTRDLRSCLFVLSPTSLELALQLWDGSSWQTVASGQTRAYEGSAGTSVVVEYDNAPPGPYQWVVQSPNRVATSYLFDVDGF